MLDLVALLVVPACTRDALVALAMLGPDAVAARDSIGDRLVHADAEVRWRAAFALAMLRADAVPALRAALDDEVAPVRLWALRALLSGDASPHNFARRVLAWLDDDREFVLAWALDMAGKIGKEASPAVPLLVQLLQRPTTSGPAADLLRGLGADAAAAAPLLIERLDQPGHVDGFGLQYGEQAMMLLGAIGPRAGAATDRLLELATAPVAGGGTDLGMQQALENRAGNAIGALAKIAPDRAFAALLPGFEADGKGGYPGEWHDVARFAALGPAAAPALPRLRELLRSADDRDREKALVVIRAIGERAAPALPDLLPLLAHPDGRMRMILADAITAIGPAAAGAVPEFEAHFAHDPPRMRGDLVDHASCFGSAAEPLLVKALADEISWIRSSAAGQLLRLPQISDAARKAVLARLDDPADAVVREALYHLSNVPALREECRRQARRLVGRPSWDVRDICVHVLWDELGHAVPRRAWQPRWGGAALESLLGQWGMANRSAEEMAVFGEAAATASWALAFVTSETPHVRAEAAELLGQLPPTPVAVAALRRLTTDADAAVRAAATLALGDLDPPAREALPDLARAFADRDWFVRAAAAVALRAVHTLR
ncbi:MAG: HEAT repeat domain-containing protein [Planctomycetota bacterium]